MSDDRSALMRQIRDEVADLKSSPLYKYRISSNYFPVIGEGSHSASIMFIGEAPGRSEAEQGRPFCGAAGKLLDELLASIGVDRKTVYITNIVKDRPPENRDPLPEEIELYAPFLMRQIEIIRPKVIATLGRFSMAYLMEKLELAAELKPISQIHGKVFGGTAPHGEIKFIPLYHPAVALYNGTMRSVLFEDFKVIERVIKGSV